jgi:hypothetical protein
MIECSDCVSYRHFLKDILRGDTKDGQKIAAAALCDEHVSPLGKVMHKIVKAAVQYRLEDWADNRKALEEAVDALLQHDGATVNGWKTSRE